MSVMDLFTDPIKAILEAKKSKSIGTSIGLLLLVAFLLAISSAATMLLLNPYSSMSSYSMYGYGSSHSYIVNAGPVLISAAVTFFIVFLGGLLVGYLLSIVMRTLGCTGGFYEGLTTVAYALFVPGVTIFAGGLLTGTSALLKSGGATSIAMIIGGVLMFWGAVLGLATLYRALKELFSADLMTAFIGIVILGSAAAIVVYQIIMTTIMSYMYMPIMY